MSLHGKTALVTGGSGFIGGRLIEVLTQQFGMRVRAPIRSASSGGGAFRAAAVGAEFVTASLLDEAALADAVKGCDYVFHCAYGSHGSLAEQREVTVEGTRRLGRVAAAAGVRHFVNLSTLVVYGAQTPAVVDETYGPIKDWPKWPYPGDKRDAENVLIEEHQRSGLPLSILRLGVIYGPYGASFTLGPIAALLAGQVALVDDGRGISNATYVDDAVQGILLAAQRTEGTPEIFTIKGPDRVTWREFYAAYEAMLGTDSLVALSRAEMAALRGRAAREAMRRVVPEALAALKASPGFKRTAGALPYVRSAYGMIAKRRGGGAPPIVTPAAPTPAPRPIQTIPDMMADYYGCTTDYTIDKARTLLGYRPAFDLARGMQLTGEWARWANLIPK